MENMDVHGSLTFHAIWAPAAMRAMSSSLLPGGSGGAGGRHQPPRRRSAQALSSLSCASARAVRFSLLWNSTSDRPHTVTRKMTFLLTVTTIMATTCKNEQKETWVVKAPPAFGPETRRHAFSGNLSTDLHANRSQPRSSCPAMVMYHVFPVACPFPLRSPVLLFKRRVSAQFFGTRVR